MDEPEPLGREYLLYEEIGRGALAVVRRATSRRGGPPLAVKLLRPEYADDRRVRELFLREEAALRELEHPSIVGLRDLVVERGTIALVMEYVDGPNLRRHLADMRGRLPASDAAWIGAQAAAALAVAHVQGVVHLDLKPENILVVRGTDPVRIRIADFGVAALLLDADPAVAGGTPGYQAPELATGGAPTAAADVWSLGVVLREMLGGDLPEPLAAVAEACLADDPRDRPSARTVAIRLRDARTALLGGAPAAASAATPAAASAAASAAGDGQRDTRLRPGVAPRVPESPAGPPPARRWRRGPLLTLAAGAVLAAVLTGLTVAAAAGQNDDPVAVPPVVASTAPATAPATTVSAPAATVSAPAAAPPATTPVRDRTRATFAGRVPGSGTLAISVRDGVAIAYICDGKRVEAWLKGTAANGRLTLTGKDGARIAATFDDRQARGTVTVEGRTSDFDIRVAKKPSGLYRAAARVRNADVVGSWIVLDDGSQVGVLTTDGEPRPAPSLNVAAGTTTVDGTTVATSTIDVDSGAGF